MVTVKLEGMDQLKKKLAQSDVVMKKHVKALLKGLAEVGAETAQEKVRGRLHPGDAMAHLSIKIRHVSDTQVNVITLMPEHRARSIEEGRRPGEKIPVIQIARWHRGDKYLTPRRWHELRWSEKQEVLVVHSSIVSRGVPGLKYMEQAAEAIRKAAPKEISVAARGIEADLSR